MITKNFLELYNDELRYFREAGNQFSLSHPQIAQHLGMHVDGVLDPFVERLLEGAAFLSTRVQEKLNNEQPEFALQMLSRLAPLWYTPVPSIATIAIKPDLSFPQWHSEIELPRGSKVILTDPSLNNKPATFTTARSIQVQPIEIVEAECSVLPSHHLPDDVRVYLNDSSAHVRISFDTHGILPLSELYFQPLHLTLANETVRANQLITSLLNDSIRIILWAKYDNKVITEVLSPKDIMLGGINEDEALLPVAIGELPGSRLLREYFAAPNKFFSLEVHNVQQFLKKCTKINKFEILFAFNKNPIQLIGNVKPNDFHLFSTPVINLYNRHCSPVQLNHSQTEYPLVVDRLSSSLYEIYSIKNVKNISQDGKYINFSALQADTYFDDNGDLPGYSVRRCREIFPSKYNNAYLPNESMFISISPGKSNIDITKIDSLSIEALVCERHLVPSHLQQPKFHLQNSVPVHKVEILRHPSNPVPVPNLDQVWKAIQIVSINPLRYAKPEIKDFSNLLRDLLYLFSYRDDTSQKKRISSIKTASVEHHFERYQGKGPLAWVRGAELTINLNSSHHSDNGAFVFGKILHNALSYYGDLNQIVSMKLMIDDDLYAHWGAIYHD